MLVYRGRLSDSKSLQISTTFHSVVYVVLILRISTSSSLDSSIFLSTIPSTPKIMDIILNFVTYTFLISFNYHFTPSEIFTRDLTDRFSLIPEWQQVFSGFQDSTKYSCWSCCVVDSHDSLFNLQFRSYLFQAFGDRSKCTNYNWYHRSTAFFSSLTRSKYLSYPLAFFLFSVNGFLEQQNLQDDKC